MVEAFVDGIGSHADPVAAMRRSESCRVIPDDARGPRRQRAGFSATVRNRRPHPPASRRRVQSRSANAHEGLMDTEQRYTANAPTRAEVDALGGATVIEFGANWCGICAGAQPAITASFSAHPAVRHLKIEDGPGRPLGRSFGVKLWPTLVFLRDGVEVARVVRPADAKQIEADGFAALA
jgi:thioredoxin 1